MRARRLLTTSEPDTATRCDWAMDVGGPNGRRERVREARGRECCVYTLEITTAVDVYDGEQRGAEPGAVHDEPGAVPPRLWLTDHHALGSGLAVDVSAGVTSGPVGALDRMQIAMQGQTGQRPDRDHVRRVPLDDPADVAFEFRYAERHRLAVDLRSACPSHRNRYRLEGRTELALGTSHECTNERAGAQCPVELAAVLHADAECAEDLAFTLDRYRPPDPDDRRGHLELRDGGWRGLLDTHDHVIGSRDRDWGRITGGHERIEEGDGLSIELRHRVDLHATTSVPDGVWDHTGHVFVRGQAAFDSYLHVDARMDSHCGPGHVTSCEHSDTCGCAPAFTLDVDDTGARLTVDGRKHELDRPGPSAFVSVPLGRPLAWALARRNPITGEDR